MKKTKCLICRQGLEDFGRLTYIKEGKSYEERMCRRHQKVIAEYLKSSGRADRVFMEV